MQLGDPNETFKLQTQIDIEEKFNCISWSHGIQNTFRSGLIAGGMTDGSLMIWDADALLRNDQEESALLCNMDLYDEGEFFSLEFNNFKREWLATGGSSVYIANLERVDEPDVYNPSDNETNQAKSVITSVSWNKDQKLPHILATGSSNGVVNVWDLRVRKSILNFGNKRLEDLTDKNLQVSWNPKIPTQIAVTFDCESEVALEIWDLRNQSSPTLQLKDYHAGQSVHSLSWSQTDPKKILTGDRSGAICVWDIDTGIPEFTEQLSDDILMSGWASHVPSIFYNVGYNGNLTIRTIDQTTVQKIQQTHAPKWMKNPVCSTGVGNSFIYYSKDEKLVREKTVKVEKTQLEGYSTQQEQDLEFWSQNIHSLDTLCSHYSKLADTRDEQLLWSILGGLDASDNTALVAALGFDSEEVIKKTENYTGKTHANEETGEGEQEGRAIQFAEMDDSQTQDFFNNLSSQAQKDTTAAPKVANSGSTNFFNSETQIVSESKETNENWDAGAEDLIKRNLFIGNYRGALDSAVQSGRHAHALFIALAKKDDPGLLKLAIESFSTVFNDPVFDLLQNIMNEEVVNIVNTYELDRWNELAAFILSNYPERQRELLDLVIYRLTEAGRYYAACCLSLINGDYMAFRDVLLSRVQQSKGTPERFSVIVDSFRKMLVIATKTSQVFYEKEVQSSLVGLSYELLEQDQVRLAYQLLELLGDEQNIQVSLAKSTIYSLYQVDLSIFFESPASTYIGWKTPQQGRIIRQTAVEEIQEKVSSKKQKGRGSKRGGPPRNRQKFTTSRSTADHNEELTSLRSDAEINELNEALPQSKKMQIDENLFKRNRGGRRGGPPMPTKKLSGPPVPAGRRPGPPKPADNSARVPARRGAPRPAAVAKPPTQSGGKRPAPPAPKGGPPRQRVPAPAGKRGGRAPPPRQRKPEPSQATEEEQEVQQNLPRPAPPARPASGGGRAKPTPRPAPAGRPAPPARPAPGGGRPAPPARPAPPSNKQIAPPARPAPGGGRPAPPARPAPGGGRPAPPARKAPGGGRPAPPGRPAPGRAAPPKPVSNVDTQEISRGGRAPAPKRPPPRGPTRPAPKGRGPAPPPRGRAPPGRQQPVQTQAQESDSETVIDVSTLIENIEKCKELLLECIDEESRAVLYQGYLDKLIEKLENDQVKEEIMELIFQYFECFAEEDFDSAKKCYSEMKRLSGVADKNWLSVFLTIIDSF